MEKLNKGFKKEEKKKEITQDGPSKQICFQQKEDFGGSSCAYRKDYPFNRKP